MKEIMETKKATKRKELCVNTKLGQLVAYASTDPEHPGIFIDLRREWHECMAPVCLTEFTDDDCDHSGKVLPPSIVCMIWGDATREEYTYQVTCRNMEEYFVDGYSGTGITDMFAEDKKLCTDTKLGQLIAYTGGDPEYPGIFIDVKRGNAEGPVLLVEYTATENMPSNTLPPSIISKVWGDTTDENHTDAVVSEKLEEFFAYPDRDAD